MARAPVVDSGDALHAAADGSRGVPSTRSKSRKNHSEAERLYADALAYARARSVALPQWYYGFARGRMRANAYAIAGITALDQVQSALDSLNDSLATGGTFEQWQQQQAAQNLGLPRHRLENIYRTHIQTAYGAGRTRQMLANVKRRPYWMYDAINDSRVRPAHSAMDGFIARWDAPIWKRWVPPAGYQCRCSLRSLTEAMAKARGYRPDQETPDAQPDEGWAYDRRNLDGVSEGVKKAIQSRKKQCSITRLAGRTRTPLWCTNAKARDHLEMIEKELLKDFRQPELDPPAGQSHHRTMPS